MIMYSCCLCFTDISGTVKGKLGEKGPVIVTKCGHLFHTICIKKSFMKNGKEEVWAKKECPTCKMSLTVATDLIRIFPCNITHEEEGPSVDYLQEKINKYEIQILKLRDMLETSFLRNRDSEKTIIQLKMDNEKLIASINHLMNLKKENDILTDALSLESLHLKNTVGALTKNLIQIENTGINKRVGPAVQSSPGLGSGGLMRPHMGGFYAQPFPNMYGQNRTIVGFTEDHMQLKMNGAESLSLLNNLNDLESHAMFNGPSFEKKITNDCNSNNAQSNAKKVSENSELISTMDEFLNDIMNEVPTSPVKTRSSPKKNMGPFSEESQIEKLDNAKGSQGIKQKPVQLYGKFYCDKCKASWGTSRCAIPQNCRVCNNEVFPYAQVPLVLKS